MKPIVQLLRSKIIPWTMPSNFPQRRIVVGRDVMRQSDLPEGVSITTRKLNGERKILRAQRKHGNQRLYVATWPKDNLQETTVPRISCVVQGNADHLHGKYILRCGPGNFLILPPGIPHQQFGPFLQGKNREDGYCVLVHAYAYSHGILFWLTTSRGKEHVNDKADNYLISNLAMVQLMHLLVDEAKENHAEMEMVCKNCLSSLFILIAREIEAGNYVHPGPKENINASSPTASFADQVQEYIDANCHKRLKVDDAAKHMYLSNSQFSRHMRREFAMTFVQLLTQARMKRAKRMLHDTDLTVSAIAASIGFRSTTHLQSLFHAQEGCTPIEYRQQNQPKND